MRESGNRQTCYTQYKYGTTLLTEQNAIFQCELLKVCKKSRNIHGRGSENSRLSVAIASITPCGSAPDVSQGSATTSRCNGHIENFCVAYYLNYCRNRSTCVRVIFGSPGIPLSHQWPRWQNNNKIQKATSFLLLVERSNGIRLLS